MEAIFMMDKGGNLSLNLPEVLLIPEFREIWEDARNKTTKDKAGVQRGWAYKVFSYVFLSEDFKSPYFDLPDSVRKATALEDAGLKAGVEKEAKVVALIAKYQSLHESISLRLLRSSHRMVERLREYFETETFSSEDKSAHDLAKLAIANLSGLGKTVQGLSELEYQVKKEQEAAKGTRGDQDPGLFN